MNVLPCAAKRIQVSCKRLPDAHNFAAPKTIILKNGNWASRASESEQRFTTISNDVDVSRSMVIEVDDHAESAKP